MRQSLKNPGVGPAWCIIPARLDSTRLPRKLLRNDHGEALIISTINNARRAGCFDVVCVVTDSEEIAREIERWDWGGVRPAVILRPSGEFRNGTERVASMFAGKVIAGDPAVVVGLQADEPDIPADAFRRLIFEVTRHPLVDCATVAGDLSPDNNGNPNVVKVFCLRNIATWFSREMMQDPDEMSVFHHVGVYAWRPSALRWYASLSPTAGETESNLEQLRVIESGGSIRVAFSSVVHPGIDDEASYLEFCKRFKERASNVD